MDSNLIAIGSGWTSLFLVTFMDIPIVPTGGFQSSTVEECVDQIGASAFTASSTYI